MVGTRRLSPASCNGSRKRFAGSMRTSGGSHESLDHILVSQELYDQSRKRVWAFVGLELMNDHLSRRDHKESGTIDHGIVRAELEYRPA